MKRLWLLTTALRLLALAKSTKNPILQSYASNEVKRWSVVTSSASQ